MKYLYNPPSLVKIIFPSISWNTSNNKVLLTFDDGPNEENTIKILDELEKKGIKALFFCVGNNINTRMEITRQILERGHSIGNHTFFHKRITKLNKEDLAGEVGAVTSLLKDQFNFAVRYFRPPYGKFNLKTLKYLAKNNLKIVMWSLLTYDYKNNLYIVKFAVGKYLEKNSIIVLHDNPKCRNIIIDSIQYIVNQVEERGFQFGEPNECLK